MFRKLIGAFVGLAMMGMAGTANASVIAYDNFGPGDSYQGGSGWTINSTVTQGMFFSPSSSGFLSELIVAFAVSAGSAPLQPIQLTLQADNSGSPGSILETINVTVTVSFSEGNNNSPTQGFAAGTTFLDSSLGYWLVAFSSTGINIPWNFNSISDFGLKALSTSGTGGPWNVSSPETLGAFRVLVNVPEPSTLAIFALGLAGLGFVARRRRTGVGKSRHAA